MMKKAEYIMEKLGVLTINRVEKAFGAIAKR
jgi:hypothetical protein